MASSKSCLLKRIETRVSNTGCWPECILAGKARGEIHYARRFLMVLSESLRDVERRTSSRVYRWTTECSPSCEAAHAIEVYKRRCNFDLPGPNADCGWMRLGKPKRCAAALTPCSWLARHPAGASRENPRPPGPRQRFTDFQGCIEPNIPSKRISQTEFDADSEIPCAWCTYERCEPIQERIRMGPRGCQ